MAAQARAPQPGRLVIAVRPSGTDWTLLSGRIESGLSFPSAWQAELAARRLAQDLADQGHIGDIEIYLRDGELAGCLAFGPYVLLDD
jgi:hypothetical protein